MADSNNYVGRRFAFWAKFYDLTWKPLGFIRKQSLQFINPQANDKILEVGTGTGELALLCALKKAAVLGIDISKEMISRAQTKIKQNLNLQFKSMPLSYLDQIKKFNKIIFSFVLHEMTLNTAKEILVNSLKNIDSHGQLIIIDFNNGRGFINFCGKIFLKIFESKYYSKFIEFDLEFFLEDNNLILKEKKIIFFNLIKLLKFENKY